MQFANRLQKVKPSPTLALNTRAKKMQAEGIDVINLTCGEPDFNTPEHVNKAAIEAINRGFTKYTPVDGIPELKDAVIRSIKREQGISYERGEIIVTPGAKYAIFTALQAILNPGDEVLIPSPYWVSYPDQVLLAEANPLVIATNETTGFKITPRQLESHITKKTRALILNSPSNPTGAAYSESELADIAGICTKHDLTVISDEIYDGIVFDGFVCKSIASLEGMKERTVLINGASKRYAMTGWRIGFAASNAGLIGRMSDIQGQAVTNVTSFVQRAAVSAYDGPQDDAKKMAAAFGERRDYMVGRLNAIGLKCLRPQGAFYTFPDVMPFFGRTFGAGKIENSAGVSEHLLNAAHVATVPGEAFGCGGHIRLSFATSMENIKEGLNRIEKLLKQ